MARHANPGVSLWQMWSIIMYQISELKRREDSYEKV